MRKSRHQTRSKYKAATIILSALFVIYLIALFAVTIANDPNIVSKMPKSELSELRSLNLIPFATIAEYVGFLLNGRIFIGFANLLGNVILFLPLGYMAAALFPNMRKSTRILITAFAFSLIIEGCQYILARGSADIDDVILNILGGMIGYWIYILNSRVFGHRKYAILISVLMIALTLTGHFARNGWSDVPFAMDRPPDARFSTGAAIDTDIDDGVAADTPSETDETAWCLILVNKWNHVPDDYKMELTELTNGQSVDSRIYPALQEMLDAARNDGVYSDVVSGYRTAEKQQRLMDEKIAEFRAAGHSENEAIRRAEEWVAIPGASEHELGIAVDINADGVHSTGGEVYDWLDQNSYKYGFIRRYSADKTEITGVMNEQWHYRYVGVAAATEIHDRGICLEEYLGKMN